MKRIFLIVSIIFCFLSYTSLAEEILSDKKALASNVSGDMRKIVVANVTPTAAMILWMGEISTSPSSLTYKKIVDTNVDIQETIQSLKASKKTYLMNQIQLTKLDPKSTYTIDFSVENASGQAKENLEVRLPAGMTIKKRESKYFQSLFKIVIDEDVGSNSEITKNSIAILSIPSKSRFPLVQLFNGDDLKSKPMSWFNLNNLYKPSGQNIKIKPGDRIWSGALSPNSCDSSPVKITVEEIVEVNKSNMDFKHNETNKNNFTNRPRTRLVCNVTVPHCQALDIYMGRISEINMNAVLKKQCG